MSDFFGLFKNASDAERHAAGTVVFEAGDPGSKMYVVRKGTVDIRVGGETVETVHPGGVVGEMALVDSEPRSATAVVVTDAELVPVDRNRFVFLVQQTPYFALQVMQTMAARLRAMNARH
jgi:CRP/FNR family cyclic AMP-dependent transcriptional regulator